MNFNSLKRIGFIVILVFLVLYGVTVSEVRAERNLESQQISPTVPLDQNADIVLVIDRSGSMGGDLIEDAKAAAITFVNLMNMPPDQVGVVTDQPVDPKSEYIDRFFLRFDPCLLEDAVDRLMQQGDHLSLAAHAVIDQDLAVSKPDIAPEVVLFFVIGQIRHQLDLEDDGADLYLLNFH